MVYIPNNTLIHEEEGRQANLSVYAGRHSPVGISLESALHEVKSDRTTALGLFWGLGAAGHAPTIGIRRLLCIAMYSWLGLTMVDRTPQRVGADSMDWGWLQCCRRSQLQISSSWWRLANKSITSGDVSSADAPITYHWYPRRSRSSYRGSPLVNSFRLQDRRQNLCFPQTLRVLDGTH